MTTVTVYFNEAPHHFHGYEPNNPIRQVFTYTTATDPTDAAEEAYRLFNMDLEWMSGWDRETATAYRLCQLRSLSVGDVLKIGETWWVCAGVGFTEPGEAPTTYAGPCQCAGGRVDPATGERAWPVLATCGECGRSWCDRCWPAPAARCRFEYEHTTR